MIDGNDLNVPDNGRCAFCAYLRGEQPYTTALVDEQIAILVTREQRGKPHVLVIPVKHRETILDLSDDDAKALIIGVRQAARAINSAYQRPGIAIWQNNGVNANQTIEHLHFHVAGTLDDGGTEWGDVQELSLDVTDAIAQRLRPYLTIN